MTKDQALTLALKQLEFFDRSSHQHGCVWQKHLITAIKEALAQPKQESADSGITVDLLERLKATLTKLGYATPEGGLEAFGARLPTQLYNLCRGVDELIKTALAQPEQEPLAYAGVKVWVGNQQVVRLLTQTELHYAVEPWLLVELNALKCVAALKEKNT